jgi:hypothetical protein
MASLNPTFLADFCNPKTASEHTAPTTGPRTKACFSHALVALGGDPPKAANSTSPRPKPRERTRRCARAGRDPTSQHARSGAEAHSKNPVHPTVATSFPPSLDSPVGCEAAEALRQACRANGESPGENRGAFHCQEAPQESYFREAASPTIELMVGQSTLLRLTTSEPH